MMVIIKLIIAISLTGNNDKYWLRLGEYYWHEPIKVLMIVKNRNGSGDSLSVTLNLS